MRALGETATRGAVRTATRGLTSAAQADRRRLPRSDLRRQARLGRAGGPPRRDRQARGLEDRVRLVDEVCLGHCLRGPNILVQEEGGADEPFGGVLYNRMTVEDLDRVIEKHLVGGMAVRILMNRPPIKDR